MFRTVLLSIIRSFSLYIQQWYMLYRFLDSLQAGSGWKILILLHSKNKFEKLVHLVGFITRNLTQCMVTRTSSISFSMCILQYNVLSIFIPRNLVCNTLGIKLLSQQIFILIVGLFLVMK